MSDCAECTTAVKEFVFSNYRQRHVALEILYIGWKYHGFARQPTTEDTIEGHFFRALRQQKLIPEDADIATLNYSRCGRTDAGVSALGQVVALKLRSNARAESPEELPEDQEMDYPSIINKALPEDIRVLGWTTAREDFSARWAQRPASLLCAAVPPHACTSARSAEHAAASLRPQAPNAASCSCCWHSMLCDASQSHACRMRPLQLRARLLGCGVDAHVLSMQQVPQCWGPAAGPPQLPCSAGASSQPAWGPC